MIKHTSLRKPKVKTFNGVHSSVRRIKLINQNMPQKSIVPKTKKRIFSNVQEKNISSKIPSNIDILSILATENVKKINSQSRAKTANIRNKRNHYSKNASNIVSSKSMSQSTTPNKPKTRSSVSKDLKPSTNKVEEKNENFSLVMKKGNKRECKNVLQKSVDKRDKLDNVEKVPISSKSKAIKKQCKPLKAKQSSPSHKKQKSKRHTAVKEEINSKNNHQRHTSKRVNRNDTLFTSPISESKTFSTPASDKKTKHCSSSGSKLVDKENISSIEKCITRSSSKQSFNHSVRKAGRPKQALVNSPQKKHDSIVTTKNSLGKSMTRGSTKSLEVQRVGSKLKTKKSQHAKQPFDTIDVINSLMSPVVKRTSKNMSFNSQKRNDMKLRSSFFGPRTRSSPYVLVKRMVLNKLNMTTSKKNSPLKQCPQQNFKTVSTPQKKNSTPKVTKRKEVFSVKNRTKTIQQYSKNGRSDMHSSLLSEAKCNRKSRRPSKTTNIAQDEMSFENSRMCHKQKRKAERSIKVDKSINKRKGKKSLVNSVRDRTSKRINMPLSSTKNKCKNNVSLTEALSSKKGPNEIFSTPVPKKLYVKKSDKKKTGSIKLKNKESILDVSKSSKKQSPELPLSEKTVDTENSVIFKVPLLHTPFLHSTPVMHLKKSKTVFDKSKIPLDDLLVKISPPNLSHKRTKTKSPELLERFLADDSYQSKMPSRRMSIFDTIDMPKPRESSKTSKQYLNKSDPPKRRSARNITGTSAPISKRGKSKSLPKAKSLSKAITSTKEVLKNTPIDELVLLHTQTQFEENEKPKRNKGSCPARLQASNAKTSLPGHGTMKRKRYLLNALKEKNEGYEDDLFEPRQFDNFRAVLQGIDDDSDVSSISTPKGFLVTPAVSKKTPMFKDCISSDELCKARKVAEEYLYRRNKKRKLDSAETSFADPSTSKEDPEVAEKKRLDFDAVMEKVAAIQQAVEQVAKKAEKEDSDEEDSDEDSKWDL